MDIHLGVLPFGSGVSTKASTQRPCGDTLPSGPCAVFPFAGAPTALGRRGRRSLPAPVGRVEFRCPSRVPLLGSMGDQGGFVVFLRLPGEDETPHDCVILCTVVGCRSEE